LREALFSDGLVQFWLGNLRPDFSRNVMHSGKSEGYENVMGKLYEFGLRKGMRVLDERTAPFRRWLDEQIRLPNEGYFPVLYRTIVAAFLCMTGYADEPAVNEWVLKRLETVYLFAEQGKLKDAYVSRDSFRGFPKAYRAYPLINPELYPNDEFKLPWVHDVNAFLHSPMLMEDAQLRGKVEAVVDLVLRPEYQRLHVGYGVMRHSSGRYYVMGWGVHLPGYFGSEVEAEDSGRLLLLLSVLSRSQVARKHPWFKKSVALLNRYKTGEGLVCFPREFLPEKRFGYWVGGARMGL